MRQKDRRLRQQELRIAELERELERTSAASH
jgi:hypothetical protein